MDHRTAVPATAPALVRAAVIVLGAIALAVSIAACSNTFGLTNVAVPDSASHATLYDFRTARLRDPSAFDVLSGTATRTDLTSSWDFLYYVLADGTKELRPRDVVLGPGSASGLQVVQSSFAGLSNAPTGGYVTDSAVKISKGDVLAGRSRSDPGYTILCRHYFKMEVQAIDDSAGTVTLKYLINPNCEQTILVPGQGG